MEEPVSALKDLMDLKNVDEGLAEKLYQIRVRNAADLRCLGAVRAFTRIRLEVDPGAGLHMLYALEGAVKGLRAADLDQAQCRSLRIFYHQLEEALN